MFLQVNLRSVFSIRLKHYRESKDWTQYDLAAAVKMSVSAVRGYEQKTRWPDPEEIERLAEALGIATEDLLIDPSSKRKPDARAALEILAEVVANQKSPGFPQIPENISRSQSFAEFISIVRDRPDTLDLALRAVRAIAGVSPRNKAKNPRVG